MAKNNAPDQGLFGDIIQFALMLPNESEYYERGLSHLRGWLLDLADCARAAARATAERRAAFASGKKREEAR